jgi:hypothetical protein
LQLFIFNTNRQLSGIIESFEYLRWTRRYFECGAFEIKAPATSNNIGLLQRGNYIWKNDDGEAGIIERIVFEQTENEVIVASGRFATSLLSRRIIWNTSIFNGELSTSIETLLNQSLIAPENTNRQIPFIDYSGFDTGISIQTQVSYRNLMSTIFDWCEVAGLGLKTIFSPKTGHFTVTLYQRPCSYAVFSREYENIISQTYIENNIDYANTSLIGGEGEGDERIFTSIENQSGEARYEIFVDAKDLRSEDFPDTYIDALIFRGESKLNEQQLIISFDADVNTRGNLVYKTDYDLGDVVTVVSKQWGLLQDLRITEIEETYDVNGLSLDLTYGKGELTIMQKINRAGVQ